MIEICNAYLSQTLSSGIRARQLRSTEAKQSKIRKKDDVNAFVTHVCLCVTDHFASLWTGGLSSTLFSWPSVFAEPGISSTNSGPKNSAAAQNRLMSWLNIQRYLCEQSAGSHLHSSGALKWSTNRLLQQPSSMATRFSWEKLRINPKSHSKDRRLFGVGKTIGITYCPTLHKPHRTWLNFPHGTRWPLTHLHRTFGVSHGAEPVLSACQPPHRLWLSVADNAVDAWSLLVVESVVDVVANLRYQRFAICILMCLFFCLPNLTFNILTWDQCSSLAHCLWTHVESSWNILKHLEAAFLPYFTRPLISGTAGKTIELTPSSSFAGSLGTRSRVTGTQAAQRPLRRRCRAKERDLETWSLL